MSIRTVDQAVTQAVDLFTDRLLAGVDLHDAYDQIAADVLAAARGIPVDRLGARGAWLDDNTQVRFEPDMVRVPRRIQVRQMLGIKTCLGDLPSPCTRGHAAAVFGYGGSMLWTWPVAIGDLTRTVLRGMNDGEPTLITADGTRLLAPEDAVIFNDGILLDGPTCRILVEPDGTPVVHDVEAPAEAIDLSTRDAGEHREAA